MAYREDVCGCRCPECGTRATGTIWETWDSATGYTRYTVEPHGHMGNKAYRDDERVGTWCRCGWSDDPNYRKGPVNPRKEAAV